MSYLALHYGKQTLTAKEISQNTGVPQHYLSKIMKNMVNAQLVLSQKGHQGGFKLSRPPHKIKFSDVLVAAGYESGPKRCVFGWKKCSSEKPCLLHHSWSEMNDRFRQWTLKKTLADINASARLRF